MEYDASWHWNKIATNGKTQCIATRPSVRLHRIGYKLQPNAWVNSVRIGADSVVYESRR